MRSPFTARVCFTCAIASAACSGWAGDAPGEVQRLQRERDQQQTELRLKMQQQNERATRPAPHITTEAKRRSLERDQQQRQRELHDQQSRGATVPGTMETERERAGQASMEKRFETERRAEESRAAGQPQR